MFEEDNDMDEAPRRRPRLPRRKWERSPVQKPHSTPKGKRGFERSREKEELRRYMDELSEGEEEGEEEEE